jgi:hypothetical protein
MKVRNIITLLLSAVLVSGLILYSCKRKHVDYLGPEYLAAPADLTVTNYTVSDNIDFYGGTTPCLISAEFNHRVSYTITITGRTSGAKKTFIGVNDKIDASAIGGIWDGGHDGLYFFRAGELVDIVISFLATEYTVKKTVTITYAKNYLTGKNIIPVGGADYNGYESVGAYPVQFTIGSGNSNCTQTFVAPIIDQRSADIIIPGKPDSTIMAIEGNYFFQTIGKSYDGNGYFVGGLQHRNSAGEGYLLDSTWTDPSQIYFNIFVFGMGDGHTSINLEFHESDKSTESLKPRLECGLSGGNCANPQIEKDMHNPCTDDGWVYQYPVTHKGWKLISVKYSDCTPSASPTNGGSGDKIKEPGRVTRLQIGVVSSPPFNVAHATWDFPVITYGAPFDPNK